MGGAVESGKAAADDADRVRELREAALQAVLPGPRLDHFLHRFGLTPRELEADFRGWHKFVLATGDRVFLFPRHAANVGGLRREVAAYEALHGVACAPTLLGYWRDARVYPHPFAATTRVAGALCALLDRRASADFVLELMASLGRAIAQWHERPVPPLAADGAARLPRAVRATNWSRFALSAGRSSDAAAWARRYLRGGARRLGLDPRAAQDSLGATASEAWAAALEALARLERVLVHGDLHERQLVLADSDVPDVRGVLDWETARVDHPVWDFDYGEWSVEFWAWRARFAELHDAMWGEYRRRRTVELPSAAALHLFFVLQHTLRVVGHASAGRPLPEGVVGTVEENVDWLAAATERFVAER
jgi:aminoglycoside phosphotransferase (APT) family kinase protein